MKHALFILSLAAGLIAGMAAQAAERTITLSIPAMDCASCPYIIKQTIGRLDGVRAVEATLADRIATVTFDDAITDVEAITRATLDVGYEAVLIGPAS